MGKVKIVCAWHPKYFGCEKVIREEEWKGEPDGASHSMCQECHDIMLKKPTCPECNKLGVEMHETPTYWLCPRCRYKVGKKK